MSGEPFALVQENSPSDATPMAADRLGSAIRHFSQELLSHPFAVLRLFWAGGFTAVVIVALVHHWSHRSFLTLMVLAAINMIGFCIRLFLGRRLPDWTIYIDLTAGLLLSSALTVVGATEHLYMASFYVWVGVFAAMYFSTFVAFAFVVGVGVTYGIILAVGPRVRQPVMTWIILIVSLAVVTMVVSALVSALRSTSSKDSLTGLANRRLWDEHLDDELDRAQRSGQAIALAMIDLDGFKSVNDSLGHEAGNRLLRDVALSWTEVMRGGGNLLARIGGDEFGVLAPGCDEFGIRRLAERLVEALPEGVRCSYGVATWNRTENGSDLLRRADQAMYEAKRRHRERR
jgi:diguanylate cyclase (GGDEF)-like protein